MIATRPKTKRKTPAAKKTRTGPGALTQIAVAALEDMKAVNVKVLDVRKLTDIADTMIVATGTSDRHVKSIADRLIERCREAGHRAYGVEGQKEGEWVLVDLQDLIVHVMLPRIREFYGLEKLWDLRPAQREPSVA
jgi:ribosome-associated protein